MESNRELLELAAKAAEYQVTLNDDVFYLQPSGLYWSPLTDGGDAMRLMERLKKLNRWPKRYKQWRFVEYASTRRAIVQAAAEIGKTLG